MAGAGPGAFGQNIERRSAHLPEFAWSWWVTHYVKAGCNMRIFRKHILIVLLTLAAASAGVSYLTKNFRGPEPKTPIATGIGNPLANPEADKSGEAQNKKPETVRDSDWPKPSRDKVALPGEVPAALNRAKKIQSADTVGRPVTLTVVLRRTDQPGFEKFFEGLQDPTSRTYRQYLNPREQA